MLDESNLGINEIGAEIIKKQSAVTSLDAKISELDTKTSELDEVYRNAKKGLLKDDWNDWKK